MAGRILNRRELRKQADQAEQAPTPATEADALEKPKKKTRAKAPAAPKARKPRKKKAAVRICARWGVFDNSMKQVAIFDYNQRAAADQKVADLAAKKNAVFFLQIVKEPIPEPQEASAV
jgi:hypothetical protein